MPINGWKIGVKFLKMDLLMNKVFSVNWTWMKQQTLWAFQKRPSKTIHKFFTKSSWLLTSKNLLIKRWASCAIISRRTRQRSEEQWFKIDKGRWRKKCKKTKIKSHPVHPLSKMKIALRNKLSRISYLLKKKKSIMKRATSLSHTIDTIICN